MSVRVAVVTGGSGGIGRAVCLRLARSGYAVAAVSRTAAAFDDDRITAFRCDVTDPAQVAELGGKLDSVTVVVNNAGMAETARFEKTTVDSWEAHLRTNATSALLVSQAFLPQLRKADWGRIIAIASTASHVGTRYTTAYTASKHAMLGVVRALAAEVAGSGVTSNAVCPTFVRTPMTDRSIALIEARTGRDGERELAAASPLGRLVEPAEVAAAVAYFASAEAGCVNGQSLVLDGGGLQL